MSKKSGQDHRYISWSQYKIWEKCQHSHWLQYHDGHKLFEPNKFTDFGSAVHETAEDYFGLILEGQEPDFNPEKRFSEHLLKIVGENYELYPEKWKFQGSEIEEMVYAGKNCSKELIEFILSDEEFQGWKVHAVEYDLDIPISDNIPEWKFKGYIDLVLEKDGKYYLIDYKTCSWGWGRDKTTDPLVMGQIQAYKHFWMKTHPEIKSTRDVKIAYVLVKRTAKDGKRIQVLKSSAGPKKLAEIQKNIEKMAKTFQKGVHEKTGRLNNQCLDCAFYNSEKCPLFEN